MTHVIARLHQGMASEPRQGLSFGPLIGRAEVVGVDTAVARRVVSSVTIAFVVVALLWSPHSAIGVSLVVVLTGVWGLRRRARRVELRRADAAVEVLARCARELRAGVPPVTAVRRCADDGPVELRRDLAAVVRRIDFGEELIRAFELVHPTCGSRDVATVWFAMRFGLAHGGNAAVLDSAAASVRSSRQISREVTSLTAQARLSAQVLAALPLGFFALSSLVGGDHVSLLFVTDVGRLCLVGGLALEAAGAVWLWMLIRRLER